MEDQRLEAKSRPTNWAGYVGNKPIVEKLQVIEGKSFKEMPCILLAGPPGCGKTLAFEILIRNLKKKTKNLISHKLNASDKRKLDDIRELKFVAEKRNPQFIFMDEFDAVTKKAQEALRVVMEDQVYANTRWGISCNNPKKIIGAIKSRCAVFRFENHDLATILGFLVNILDKEGVEYDIDDDDFQLALFELIESRDYDLRGCINQLSTIITEDKKLTLTGVVRRLPVDEVGKILHTAYEGNYKDAKTLLNDILVQKNHDYRGIINVWYNNNIENQSHAKKIHMALSEYEDRCERGNNPRNHLLAFLSFVSLLNYIPSQ